MPIESYQDLDVWQRAMTLAEMAYGLTKPFPKEELFGLTSQIRRAAVSIPANIAEGWDGIRREFPAVPSHRAGSLRELETHILLTQRIKLTAQEATAPILDTCQVVGCQLIALQRSLGAKHTS